ncbi:MAG: hypothetical protein WBR29_09460 [Gammaproteobacteria bacterium]
MNTHPFLQGLGSNPDFLLQNFDLANRRALVVRVNESVYREASFLDDRILNPQTEGFWLPLESVLQQTGQLTPAKPHYIFHVGHCGSTLISRLLAELPHCLPLREPMSLLTLAVARRELGRVSSWLTTAQWNQLLQTAISSLARTYRKSDKSLIKVTSNAGNLLESLLPVSEGDSHILMMYISLESYLAVMLRTQDLRASIHAFSPVWMTDFCRLTGRTDLCLAELGDAQQITLKWLVILMLFVRAGTSSQSESQLLNFDKFLMNPLERFMQITGLFKLECDMEKARQLLDGPMMQRYSKIPTQSFNHTQRNSELRDARQKFQPEINAGLKWAETLCREIPALASVAAYLG